MHPSSRPDILLPAMRFAALAAAACALTPPHAHAEWRFVDVTVEAGVATSHGYEFGYVDTWDKLTGGAAAGDIDRDGDIDLFVLRGDLGPARLFRNDGAGHFDELSVSVGLAFTDRDANGAVFADVDGDGSLDLLVGGVKGAPPRLFLNDGTGHFADVSATSGLVPGPDTFSAALGDYDGDGLLDLFLAHWTGSGGSSGNLWRNLGGGVFEDVGAVAAIDSAYANLAWSFTPNFADIDSDGRPDLLVAADFGTSRIFRNLGDGRFENTTTAVISDENGMGAAVADYDNDGDLDWFVSSIWDPDGNAEGNWGTSGNRLYRNLGNGTFEDATDAAGVRQGYWGWGSTFADFNNDGHLDLYHVNGFPTLFSAEFEADSARLFIANGDGTFAKRASLLGVADTQQGRGVVAFDYDRDGDLDLFVSNNAGDTRLFRNDGGNDGHYLSVRLHGREPNTWAVGARVWVTTPDGTQMRELSAGNNYLSSNPIEAHFGLGSHTTITELKVRWPGGDVRILANVAADQHVELWDAPVPITANWAIVLLMALLAATAWPLRARWRARSRH